ncbi:TRAP transporter small permease subunit [Aquibium sp. LZ166]|uniref:TRAP transporter small permease protein n=1 Tax=Aquibium pacificus TaxID=3153579 RepID=A0ABV3SPA5_9HYPH
MRWLSWAGRGVDGLERLAITGASLCILAIMVVVALDVVMRYAFHAPLGWVYDLVSNYLMVGAFFLAVSETFRRGGHVAVDLFRNMLRPRVRRWIDAGSALMVLPVLLAMVVTGWQSTARSLARDEAIPGVIAWPMWASYVFVPLGVGLLLLRVALHLADLLWGGRGHVPEVVDHLHAKPAAAAGSPSQGEDR